MSKYKDELITRLNKALGKDCADVVEELYALKVMDDTLSRRGCLMHEYLMRAIDTSKYESDIRSELGEIYGCHERTVLKIVGGY